MERKHSGGRIPRPWGPHPEAMIPKLRAHVYDRFTVLENAFPAAPAARPTARSLGNLPNLWIFLDSTLLCSPRGLGPGFTI